jgi:sec-independent protein translocase protein TatA
VGGFLGFWEILIIAGILLLIFGPKRVPQLGRSLGRGLRELRHALPSSRDELEDKSSGEPTSRTELKTRERDSVS